MTGNAFQADGGNQYVTLGLGGEVFAVEVRAVSEILDLRPVAHMPNGPPFLMGLIDVRGRGVPVIDLRVKLGLPPAPPTEQTRILVIDAEIAGKPEVIGLLVERVFEVTELDNRRLEPPPEIGIRWRSDYIAGIGRRHGAFVIILGMSALLSGEEAAFLGGEVAA